MEFLDPRKMTVARCLSVLNFLIALPGVLLVIIGIYLISISPPLDEPDGAAILSQLVLAAGCLVTSLAFVGYCGVAHDRESLLGFYIFLLMMNLSLLFTVCIVCGFFSSEMEVLMCLEWPMQPDVFLEEVQAEFQCCGCAFNDTASSRGSWCLANAGVRPGCQRAITDFMHGKFEIAACVAGFFCVLQLAAMGAAAWHMRRLRARLAFQHRERDRFDQVSDPKSFPELEEG